MIYQMKYKTIFNKAFFFLILVTFTSCSLNKKIVYLQSDEKAKGTTEMINYEPLIQPDDEVLIVISAENPEVTVPYNIITTSNSQTGSARQGYLIDKEGNVDFPILGKIKIGGLTRIQAVNKIRTLLANDIKDPTVNLRVINFKVSVLGEVASPGVKTINSERLTLLDAISMSGDLTVYGKRNSIMIVREIDGTRTIAKVDITKRDFMNSKYYYLEHNDIIYVEPNKTKINSSAIGPNVSIIVSILSLVTTILFLVIRL